MNHVLKRFQILFGLFTKITTGILIVTAVYICIFWGWETELSVELLWQILITAAVCTLGSLFLPLEEQNISKRISMLSGFLYFAFVNVAVFFCGIKFEWFYLSDWRMALGMEIMILFVYGLVRFLEYMADYKMAEKMNQKLRERK